MQVRNDLFPIEHPLITTMYNRKDIYWLKFSSLLLLLLFFVNNIYQTGAAVGLFFGISHLIYLFYYVKPIFKPLGKPNTSYLKYFQKLIYIIKIFLIFFLIINIVHIIYWDRYTLRKNMFCSYLRVIFLILTIFYLLKQCRYI